MTWSPDDRQIIYTSFNQQDGPRLHIVPFDGGTSRPFSDRPIAAAGPVWSPDGSRVAFRYYRNGAPQIWTSDSSGGDLRQDFPFSVNGSARMVWSPDGKRLAVVWDVNGRLMIVPPSGGDPKLFDHGVAPALSLDGKRVAYYCSEESELTTMPLDVALELLSFAKPNTPGAEFRLCLKPADGGETKRLNSVHVRPEIGAEGLVSLDWSPDGKRLLTTKPVNGSWQLTVLNVEQDKVELMVPVNGSARNPRWSHDSKRIAYDWVDTGHPARLEVLTLADRRITQLTRSAAYTNAHLVRYRTGSGIEIPSWLYLPRKANQTRHPALIWLHGSAETVTNTFIPRFQYLVDQGFVVLVVNYGPSSGLGDQERRFDRWDDFMPDIFASVDYLKTLKSVDRAHIGIAGHSRGGYATLRSIVAQPDLFFAAVDESGPSDMLKALRAAPPSLMTSAVLDHFFGGTPEQKPEAYRTVSPIYFVERAKTPLLILHGTADQRVPYHQSADLAEGLERAGKEHQLITYKGAGHNFAGKDEIDANQQILRFLLAHLTPAKRQ
jgi:dipeptidyl aminopeptidase/acylaminoacyl peptidase